jgi:outer membrane lipoprotein-sorting protein
MMLPPELRANSSPPTKEQVMEITAKIEAAYAQLEGYRTETEVSEYQNGRLMETKRFLYTFKKPDHLRIEMQSPYPGMILVYPDENGKVAVKLGGWAGFLKLHLSPDSTLLKSSSGQRVDQTDLGLLIRHISRSVTGRSHGEAKISEANGRIIIEVLADNHFLPGVLTLYRFSIDTALWLPVEVEELTPEGVLKRKAYLRSLRTLSGIPDNLFRID